MGETFEPKRFFFKKWHSFHINVIPSGIPNRDYCHSFHINVIPSQYYHSLKIIPISNMYMSFLIAPVPSHTRRVRKLVGRAGHICEYLFKICEKWLVRHLEVVLGILSQKKKLILIWSLPNVFLTSSDLFHYNPLII